MLTKRRLIKVRVKIIAKH